MAQALADVVDHQELAVAIQGRRYVRVEGWTTLAVMLGVVAREVDTREEGGVYTATVELVRMSDGAVISRASAECGDEAPWNKRARYARRSMAQTRATGKACRLAFSWIMALAGYEPTPAEEIEPLTGIGSGPPTPLPTPPLPPGATAESGPTGTPAGTEPAPPITPTQRHRVEARMAALGLDRERVSAWLRRAWGVERLEALPRERLPALEAHLERWAHQPARTQGT